MPVPDLKKKILHLLDQAYQEEQSFLATLSDEQRAATGSPEHWSAKDILIHIAVWKERMVESLDAAAVGKPYTAFDDIDKSNAKIFEEHSHDSWKEAIKRLEQAEQNLVGKIHKLKVIDLINTQFLSWQKDRPLWRLIVMNGFYHPVDHLARFYLKHGMEHGEVNYGTQIQEEAAELLRELDNSSGWLGVVAYNLACLYAQAGEKDKALRNLEDALRLAPDLLDWSKQDSDLASLREETDL